MEGLSNATHVPADRLLRGLPQLVGGETPPPGLADAARELHGGLPDETPMPATREHVRYRPERSCVTGWSFAGASGPQLVAALLLPGGRGERYVRRARFRAALRAAGGAPEQHCRTLWAEDLLVTRFPFDARLAGLVPAHDARWVRDVLAPRTGLDPTCVGAPRALSYKPERRCVLRYEDGARAVFAKVYRDDRAAALFSRVRQVSTALETEPFRTPPPLVHLAQERVLAFEGLDHVREVKDELLDARTDDAAALRLRRQLASAAAGLPALRRVRLEGVPARQPRALLAWLEERAGMAVPTAPELAAVVRSRIARLEHVAARLAAEEVGLAHGALRHDQLVARGDAVFVLDFDTLCMAGASADPGNLLGNLDMLAARRPRLAGAVEVAQLGFLDALDANMHGGWLAWHRAAAQVKKLLRAFFSVDRKWRDSLDASGPLFERTLADLERSRCFTS